MLILSRKNQEVIHIGNDIWIKILNIAHNAVRIGIEAPKEMSVDRQEIYYKKMQDKFILTQKDMTHEYVTG